MNWLAFIRDRIALILAFVASTGLSMIVTWLSLLGQNVRIGADNVVYMFLLGLFMFSAAILWDGMRQREYRMSVRSAIEHGSKLEAFVILRDPVTHEQAQFQEMAYEQFKAYHDELDKLQQNRDMQQYFTDQWVHLMKTPVSVIELNVQQAGRVETVEDAQALLRSVAEENARLAHHLEMMLNTARLDKFELDLHIRQVPLLAICRDVINAHKKSCIQKSIFPRIVCEEQEVYVESDEKWLRLALHQFVSNAIKYTKPDEDSKTLLISVDRGASTEIVLRVKDQGIGIEAQDLPRVFEPFFTGENGRAMRESTGMGLFIAKQICIKLGHGLTIESSEGHGTAVTIHFASDSLHKSVLTDER